MHLIIARSVDETANVRSGLDDLFTMRRNHGWLEFISTVAWGGGLGVGGGSGQFVNSTGNIYALGQFEYLMV